MKKIRVCFSIVAMLSLTQVRAQHHSFDTTSYSFPAPAGWGKELFPIPIEFAPSIPFKGQEELRFAPGWGKADNEEYWSYTFVWFLQGHEHITAENLKTNLEAYYTGLIGRNIEKRKISKEKLFPVSVSVKPAVRSANAAEAFIGEISMLDYMAQKPIKLYVRAQVKPCSGDHTTILFQISPAAEGAPIRKKLQQLVDDFNCK